MAIRSLTYQQTNFNIAYELIDNQSNENIIFLHGWGSNKELMFLAFNQYFKLFNHYYIDLPGFGRSFNEKPLNTQDYAQIIQLFFNSLNIKPKVIVGHSFGGKIATLLQTEMILLSSAGILETKPIEIKIKIFLAKILKNLHLSSKLLRSKDTLNLNEGMYLTFKNVVNEDFSSYFSNFSHCATIFWGSQDKATSPISGKKISKLIKNSRFYLLEGDHYFFLKQGKIIEKLYYEAL